MQFVRATTVLYCTVRRLFQRSLFAVGVETKNSTCLIHSDLVVVDSLFSCYCPVNSHNNKMANNGGRAGGGAGGANGQMNEHVEFTVKVSVCVGNVPLRTWI